MVPFVCVLTTALNAVTRKNRNPVSPMNQLLTIFNGFTIFSKIDLCDAYNILRIKEGDEHLMAFRAKYGIYGYLIMPFGLTNAPASFQNLEAPSQFQVLKEAFTTAPILPHCNPSLPTIGDTDAPDYALEAVLSQVNDSGKSPISFDSRKLLPAELNYEIHGKEHLGIAWALKCQRSFLLSLSNPFKVLTYHSFLQHFMSSNVLTCCQNHWAEFHSDFHFTINYHPGRLATLPDALPRWDDMFLERGPDLISNNPKNVHQVIKQDGIQESKFFSIKAEIFSELAYQIQKEVWQEKDHK
ncbi:hypothetical protein O181_091263 [Austropuccinia psidii MF-1]|uniref:Reverse transcriptase/retrotransposon-derived protein RNase H-like domain-containing protein n=1 Tax=Austropuccinia psidii MF-1 TaxID=1389203 RepID=A0A9Q3IX15_9BASI|nr:hypothetical protein [Austropuccinia psidii MF-1]